MRVNALKALTVLGAGILMACGATQKSATQPDGGQDTGSDATVGSSPGNTAPEIYGEYVSGDGPKTIADAKGQVIIVDFWATYCEPCKKSFPAYQELVDKHAGNVVVVGVSVDDPEDVKVEDVRGFAEELGVTFPIVWDKERKTASAYKPPKMPTSYLIDKSGAVRHVHEGFTPEAVDKMNQEVEEMLK